MRIIRSIAAACFAALSAHATAQTTIQPTPPAATERVSLAAAVLERAEHEMQAQKIVGLSLTIGIDGKLVLSRHLGFEDREAGVPASRRTMYRWASVSKPMTAVVAMQLAREGKLNLDADVRTLVPEFPEKPWPITSRQLLCHQGGIVHYTNGVVIRTRRTYEQDHPFADCILALDMFKESPLLHEPGTKYAYTTHGYMLLGAAAERAGGAPFAELVRARVAEPCGMTTLRPDYQWEAIPNRAVGYRKGRAGAGGNGKAGDGDEAVEAVMVRSTDTDVSWKLAGGGWISTSEDMALFGLGMLSGKLVDAPTREAMWTPQKTSDAKATTYGLGFNVGSRDGRPFAQHSGSQEKTATMLVLLPDESGGVCVAVMCNTEGTRLGDLAHDLARLAAASRRTEQPSED